MSARGCGGKALLRVGSGSPPSLVGLSGLSVAMLAAVIGAAFVMFAFFGKQFRADQWN